MDRRTPLLIVSLLLVNSLTHAAEPTRAAEQVEFFEKKIRPVLVQHCYKCHSAEIAEPKAGLRLDSRDALRRGGDSGPAVVPGKLAESLLIDALAHDGSFVNMPPSGRLPDTVIADFRQWIIAGAVDPRDQPSSGKLDWQQVLAGRKSWWCWQPLALSSIPAVRNTAWSSQPVDRFLQAAWESVGIEPAASADPATLIRRVTFILTGLPPTPDEVRAFVHDFSITSETAYIAIVDRLLASPRFGERWGRHWMDLVRYGETHGSEHDPLVPHAYRYRDYLIRAFNDDVPYDRFLHEQLAGDLLPPRWNRSLGINESLLGTMFYRMVEFYPTPVDAKSEEVNVIESQIDTFGKTFQALTLACARCHDHKFDAISAHDFAALYGIFASTRTTMHRLDDPAVLHAHDNTLRQQLPELRRRLAELWRGDVPRWPRRIEAASARLQQSPAPGTLPADASELDRDALALQQATGLAASPLYALSQLIAAEITQPRQKLDLPAWQKLQQTWLARQQSFALANRERYQLYADFSSGQLGAWYASGGAFQAGESGAIAPHGTGDSLLAGIYPRGFYTHLLSDKHGGTLRSPNITLDMNVISALVAGTNRARLRLVVENFQGNELLYQRSNPVLNGGGLNWVSIAIRPQWKGRRGYLELIPRDDMTYVGKVADAGSLPRDGRSGVGIRYVVFHNDPRPPEPEPTLDDRVWHEPPQIDRAVAYLRQQTSAAIDAWLQGTCDDRQARLLDALLRAGLLSNSAPADHLVGRAWAEYLAVEQLVPVPQRAPGVADEDGTDERLFPRGDYRQAAETVPRRYLEVLHSSPYRQTGSGRLQLAQELTSRDNPLTARVMVNRVWQHVFGAGLVRTVDNFGQLGEPPSHAALLDWLANHYVEQGWSTKQLIRLLLLSRTFQLSTAGSAQARERDPDNRQWSHATLRRLEAEAIRDSLLFVSGRLNGAMFGLGVPLPLVKGYKDFDVPDFGPLDGDGRRSVYLEARRNYPLAMLLAFDQPRPMLSVGRRDVTNVPAQSLTLLNDPLVWQQAERFATRTLHDVQPGSIEPIASMYLRAFGRLPTAGEHQRAERFLIEQSAQYSAGNSSDSPSDIIDPRAWRDLAHALFNRKEFIYLR